MTAGGTVPMARTRVGASARLALTPTGSTSGHVLPGNWPMPFPLPVNPEVQSSQLVREVRRKELRNKESSNLQVKHADMLVSSK